MENLSTAQREMLLRFLLGRMGMETRRQFMTELPVVYAAMYPTVQPETIVEAVRDGINEARRG